MARKRRAVLGIACACNTPHLFESSLRHGCCSEAHGVASLSCSEAHGVASSCSARKDAMASCMRRMESFERRFPEDALCLRRMVSHTSFIWFDRSRQEGCQGVARSVFSCRNGRSHRAQEHFLESVVAFEVRVFNVSEPRHHVIRAILQAYVGEDIDDVLQREVVVASQ